MTKIHLLQEKLKDERGGKVIFLSHCLLNENTRYLGGACRKAGVDELIDVLQEKGIGMVQMICPEQKTWGGVLKREMLRGYCIKGTWLRPFLKIYMVFFLWKIKRAYKKIARDVVSEMKDYIESGFEVAGIMGIKGSPSCGVSAALDLKKSSEFAADLDFATLNRGYFNENCYKKCMLNESGLFIDELKKELSAHHVKVNLYEHDLLTELQGKNQKYKF